MKIEEAQVALLCRERIFAVAARCSSLTFDRCCFSLLSPCPFGILLLLVRPCWVPPSALRWAPPFVRSLSRETFLLIQADNPQVRLHCGRRGEKRLGERCCPLSPAAPPLLIAGIWVGGGGGSWAPLEVRPPEEKIWALEGDSSTEVPGVRRLRPSLPLPEGEVASS